MGNNLEQRLAQEGLDARIGGEAERHGHTKDRVLSLDVYPHLSEQVLATWDRYVWDEDEKTSRASDILAQIPDHIRAIAEERLAGQASTPAKRKQIERFRKQSNLL